MPTRQSENESIRIAPKAEGPVQIDLRAVLKEKLGGKSKLVPGFVVRWLERTICAERLNKLLADNYPSTGADFCNGVFRDLSVKIESEGKVNLPPAGHRRVVVVSNHPLGGLDGMALISFFTEYYGGSVHFVVNDMLMAVKPLNDVFVPVNTVGAQNRKAALRLDKIFAGDDPVIIFPAGLVSRLTPDGKDIADLEWKKMFVNRAIASQRDIVPVFFDGKNSGFFYKFARRRKKFGIKFNIEMIYLPREVFRSEGKTFRILCGKPLPWQTLEGGSRASATAIRIRNVVYGLVKDRPEK